MERDVRWIHISDLHIGSEKNKWIDSTIQKELVYYLKNDIGRIDFILITGDIINKGKYNNYELRTYANELLSELKKVSENIIFCVGNHDYLRSDGRFKLLADWQMKENKKKEEDEFVKRLNTDFDRYVDFCKKNTSDDNPISTNTYIYKKISSINVVVLNTSTFAGQPEIDEKGNIKRDKDGNVIVNDNGKIWIAENDLPSIDLLLNGVPSIVVGHHPLEEFDPKARKIIQKFINTINAKYFCGHAHRYSKNNFNGTQQTSISGLFVDDYNNPSFTYNIIRKEVNAEVSSKRYIYDKNWTDLRSSYNDSNLCVYDSLDRATLDIANDILSSDFLYFFGLQGSTFLPSEDNIHSAIMKNKELLIKLLISSPYNENIISRLHQIPKYNNQAEFENKVKKVNNIINLIKNEYMMSKNAIIKYHKLPITYRTIITKNHLYIGMYEDKDSSESKIYRFNSSSSLYKASVLHFNTFWNNAEDKISSVVPEWYRIIEKQFSITPSLVINVADKCDMDCQYCPDGGENLEKNLQLCDIKFIKTLIRMFKGSISKFDKSVIRITGGEPLNKEMEQRTIEILKEAINIGYEKIVLCTNGIYFSEAYKNNTELFDFIKEKLLLKFSLDSIDEKIFNEVTRTTGKLATVISNIVYAKELGFNIELNVVVTKYNIDKLMDIYEFAAKNSLIGIKLLTVNDFGGNVKNIDSLVDDSVRKKILNLVDDLKKDERFSSDINVFLNDNKGIEMKKFKDSRGCIITIVDHENAPDSVTPRRVFCSACRVCSYYPASPDVVSGKVKPCATGIMSLTLRADGKLSICRLINGSNINKKSENAIKNIVQKEMKKYKNCFVYGGKGEDCGKI